MISPTFHLSPKNEHDGKVDEAELWADLLRTGSKQARDELFSLHLPYAYRLARQHRLNSGRPDIELADLRQLACAGLLEAIDRYDPDRGAPFRPYAKRRIIGSLLDGIAKMSEVREQISFRNRIRRERMASLAQEDLDGLSIDDAMRALAELAVGLALGFLLEGTTLYVDESQVAVEPDAYESLAWKDTVRRTLEAVGELPDQERSVIRRHYIEGLDFERIALLLGLSRGRISQIHKAGLQRLRNRLARLRGFTLTR